jgi:methyl-accepting chemotaxis protein
MTQSINSYVKIYDEWIKNMDKMGKKQLELVQGLATGKEVNVAEMFDDISKSYADISNSLMESLKGTTLEEAFKGVEEVNEALKQFADSFPEEQKQTKEIFQTFCSSYVKIMNSWTASTRDVSRTLPDMLSKGEISADAYKKIVNTCSEASKESAGALLGPLSALLPDYKDMVDDVTDWTNNYFDLLASRIEVLLNLFQGITKSSSEMSRFANETFGKGEISSTEELYNSWSEFYRKAAVNLTDNVHFSTTLSNFVNSFVEYVKSTNNLYRHTMTPPFPGKEEVDKIYATIEEMATKVEKNGEPQQKTKSKQAEA